MKFYEEFTLEIVRFDEDDVICASTGNGYSVGDDFGEDIY